MFTIRFMAHRFCLFYPMLSCCKFSQTDNRKTLRSSYSDVAYSLIPQHFTSGKRFSSFINNYSEHLPFTLPLQTLFLFSSFTQSCQYPKSPSPSRKPANNLVSKLHRNPENPLCPCALKRTQFREERFIGKKMMHISMHN